MTKVQCRVVRRLIIYGFLLVAIGFVVVSGIGDGGVRGGRVTLPTPTGIVVGYLCEPASPRGIVLSLHSNAQTLSAVEPMTREFARQGFLAFAPYVQGRPFASRLTLDQYQQGVMSAAQCLKSRISPVFGPVHLAGHSLGANQAVMLADRVGADRVVAMGYDVDPPGDRKWPLLLMTGVYDQLHPPGQMREVLERASRNGDLETRLYLSPLADHVSEVMDPRFLHQAGAWISGRADHPGGLSLEPFRAVASALAFVGIFLLATGGWLIFGTMELGPSRLLGRIFGPVLVGLAWGVWWLTGGFNHSGVTCFGDDLVVGLLLGLVISRAQWPGPNWSHGWSLGSRLLWWLWFSWFATTVINAIPGLVYGPAAFLWLPVFAPWKLLVDLVQCRAWSHLVLMPWLVFPILALELWRPGALGQRLAAWVVNFVRSIQQLRFRLTLSGSAVAWGVLLLAIAGAVFGWTRVINEGYDMNSQELFRLLKLLARFALPPILILLVILRSRPARRWFDSF